MESSDGCQHVCADRWYGCGEPGSGARDDCSICTWNNRVMFSARPHLSPARRVAHLERAGSLLRPFAFVPPGSGALSSGPPAPAVGHLLRIIPFREAAVLGSTLR